MRLPVLAGTPCGRRSASPCRDIRHLLCQLLWHTADQASAARRIASFSSWDSAVSALPFTSCLRKTRVCWREWRLDSTKPSPWASSIARTKLWFEPTKTGTFPLYCAEFCGTLHSRMIGTVTVMEPAAYPGETFGDDPLEKFEGLFGIHGAMHLWAEAHSGIVVRIQGDLPVGPVTLAVDVVLDSYSGTCGEFKSVK